MAPDKPMAWNWPPPKQKGVRTRIGLLSLRPLWNPQLHTITGTLILHVRRHMYPVRNEAKQTTGSPLDTEQKFISWSINRIQLIPPTHKYIKDLIVSPVSCGSSHGSAPLRLGWERSEGRDCAAGVVHLDLASDADWNLLEALDDAGEH